VDSREAHYDDYDAGGANSNLPEKKTLLAQRPDGHLMRELIRAWDPLSHRVAWEHETCSGLLSEADVDAIHAFLIDQQKQLFEAQRTQR